jgi:hypothetical protein
MPAPSSDINTATKPRSINDKSSKGYHTAYNLYVKGTHNIQKPINKTVFCFKPITDRTPIARAGVKDPLLM